MKTILIPTDFSENAMNAITYALELFKYENAHIYLVHSYEDAIYEALELLKTESFESLVDEQREVSKAHLEQLLATIKKRFPNPKHEYHIRSAHHHLIDVIDNISEEKNIDLIIMGTKGKTNNRSLTFGSNTVKVLRYVSCPVLSIPEGYLYQQPKHILFPTNYMVPYKRRELKLLSEMSAPYRAVIDMLYIAQTETLSRRQEDNKQFLSQELQNNDLHFKTIGSDSDTIINTIFSYIKSNAVDVLVMVNTRHSFLEHLLFQSTIDELSLNLDIPFLAMQNIKRHSTL